MIHLQERLLQCFRAIQDGEQVAAFTQITHADLNWPAGHRWSRLGIRELAFLREQPTTTSPRQASGISQFPALLLTTCPQPGYLTLRANSLPRADLSSHSAQSHASSVPFIRTLSQLPTEPSSSLPSALDLRLHTNHCNTAELGSCSEQIALGGSGSGKCD